VVRDGNGVIREEAKPTRAIQRPSRQDWIAARVASLAMTVFHGQARL
jgi:hypothetical protein